MGSTRRYLFILAGAWCLTIGVSLAWNLIAIRRGAFVEARTAAREAFNKDLLYRRWVAGHGGVYVPVTKRTPPNPYLSGVPEREISTPSGRILTLVNPAYMTRQVFELALEQNGVRGHITSLQPIRKENEPDPWERKALLAFASGASELSEVEIIDGEPFLRLMRPMITESRCLKCHATQGYTEGEIRGGISVSVPMARFQNHAVRRSLAVVGGHGLLWLLGIGGLVYAGRDIGRRDAARRATELRLKESEQHLREVYEAVDTVALVTTGLGGIDTRIVAFSPGAEKIFGYAKDEVIGERVSILHPPDAGHGFQALQDALSDHGAGFAGEVTLVRKNGDEFPALFSVHPRFGADGQLVGTVGVSIDLTERKAVEEQLRQAQKMEAIGQLAGGIAHDFNNLLQVIAGYGGLVLETSSIDDQTRDHLGEVVSAADRAARLVGQLLAFSRQQVLDFENLAVDAVIRNLATMVRRVIGEHITLHIHSVEDLGTVYADRSQIEQVVLNLCVNARDAMPAGGDITIQTENVVLDQVDCMKYERLQPGRYVLLSVRDNGEGIDEETRGRIFEPFFTTKGIDKGTGLGLATVYGILRQHRGAVGVESEVGRGSVFRVYLPTVDAEATALDPRLTSVAAGGNETILVAEDDDGVRGLAARILDASGYTVLAAKNGHEAIEIFDAHRDDIDLALLDMVMPKLGGVAVAAYIRSRQPATQVLFTSGYSAESLPNGVDEVDETQRIQKPYSRVVLLTKIREALDR